MTSPTKINPRRLALKILRAIEQRQGFSNRILAEHLERHPELEKRDRGFVTTLVYGVLRHRIRLDACIAKAAHQPQKIKGEVRDGLRIGIFEILELARPLAIASAETSKALAKIDPQGRLRPVIAAILRHASTQPAGDEASLDSIDAICERWSLPRWLGKRWHDELGLAGLLARARALSNTPALDLRIDVARVQPDEVIARLQAEHPGVKVSKRLDQPQFLRAEGGGDIFYGPLFEEGLISIQAIGSQQAALALAPAAHERVLDACCGMGTKLLHLAELMGRTGTLIAADSSQERIDAHEELRERGQIEGSHLELISICTDLTKPHPLLEKPFDAILLDAPCTGLGNLARHPELRWSSQESDITACALLQSQLLAVNAQRLAPGGRLVYAVCSLEPEEGRLQVENFLAVHGDAFVCEASQTLTPEADDCDGFYWAKLRRRPA